MNKRVNKEMATRTKTAVKSAPAKAVKARLPAVVIKTQAQAEKAPEGVHPVVARGVTGLKLRKVSDEHGAGAFTLRYWSNCERRTIGLGSLSKMSLAEACQKAREYIGKRDKGIDPKDERDAERATNRAVKPVEEVVTFKQAAMDRLEVRSPEWKHKYAKAVWLNPLIKYAFPVIGDLDVYDIKLKTHRQNPTGRRQGWRAGDGAKDQSADRGDH